MSRTHGLLATYTSGGCRCEACREAARAYGQEYRARKPEQVRASKRRQDLRRHYGLSPEAVATQLDAQGGRCAICPRRLVAPVVDHDHETGRNRGLLCHRCNRGLGFLGDDLERVESAARYLREGTWGGTPNV